MDVRERLQTALAERFVILDGAWGVLLQGRGLEESDFRGERFQDHDRDVKGDPDLLNLSRPDIVTSIPAADFEAGADITTTNTFTATSIGQADYGLQDAVRDMNLEGARLARESADRHGGLVAGSLGPLNVTLSLSPKVDDPSFRTVDFDQVYTAYAEQIEALRDGGVDLLLIETIFDTLNAKASIAASIDVAPDLPRWISVTIVDRSGRRLHVLLGPRALPDHARDRLRDGRRTDEHHGFQAVRPLDRVRRLPGRRRRGTRSGGERRQPDRREHGHRPDRRRAGDDPVPQP